jgi:tryptophan 2-C-methyltransferase
MKILLVNMNLITVPAIAPYALDVLGSSLSAAGQNVDILDLCPTADPVGTIHKYFGQQEPDLVGLSMRNAGDLYFPSLLDLRDQGSFLKSHGTIVDAVKTYVDPERIVIGGAGFSVNPLAFLRRLGLRYGIRGPGEALLCRIASQLSQKTLKDIAAGAEMFVFDGRGQNILTTVRRTYADNKWYYEYGGQAAFRTSSGCALHCSYCAEPVALGSRYRKANVESTVSEIDQLVAAGIMDLHSADSEFNMPLSHSKEMLKAIIERRYDENLRFWTYCQPRPFDEEFAKLLASAGVAGISFGTDHTDPDVLLQLGKWYTREDIALATRLCQDNGIAVMHELLFGSPGDTPYKMFRAIEEVQMLEPRVIGVTIGLGVFPETPLGKFLETAISYGALDRGFYFAGEPMVDPTFYVDPAFKMPEVLEELSREVGTNNRNLMLPTTTSTDSKNNQLVNSDRVRHQLLVEKRKGPSWYHFPDR